MFEFGRTDMSYRTRSVRQNPRRNTGRKASRPAPLPTERQRMSRSMLLLVVSLVLLVVVFGRVVYIKAVHGEEYQQRAEQQQLSSTDVIIPSLRGSIYDRDGNVLAESVRVYNVILDPQALIEAGESKQINTVETLMSVLKLNDENLIRKYISPEYQEYRYLKLDQGIGISAAQMESIQMEIDAGRVVGVWFEEDEERTYVNNSQAAHIIGFNGAYGVEQYYDEYLQGTNGRKMVVAGAGNSFIDEYVAAQDGYNLTTTINSKVQYDMEQTLQYGVARLNAERGLAICMNCKTGEILGYALCPTFNLNNANELIGLSEKYTKNHPQTENDPDYYANVWNNWGISLTYEPGSTFKPIFAAAAMNENAFTEDTVFVCGGTYQIYDAEVGEDSGHIHGTQTIREVLANSCNVAMSMISENMKTAKWLQYQDAFGLAQLTGIDLAGESGDSRDLVYISAEEAEKRGTTNDMGPFEKATTSFGQGFTLTPIQLISAFASVINGGEYVKPYVVSQITDSNGNIIESHSKEVLRYTIAENVSRKIASYLQAVVLEGTGLNAQVPGYSIGGKTGTAEQVGASGTYEDATYIVSFVSFTPVEDPEIILLVVLDRTDQDISSQAARLNGQIMEKILPDLGMYPDPSLFQESISPNSVDVASGISGYDYGEAQRQKEQEQQEQQENNGEGGED